MQREVNQEENLNRIITVPNLLSFFRLCLIPVIIWSYGCVAKSMQGEHNQDKGRPVSLRPVVRPVGYMCRTGRRGCRMSQMMVPFTCFRQSIAVQALHITKLYQKYMDGSFQNSLLIWKPGRGSKGGGGTAVPGTDRISAKIEVKYVWIF